MKMVRLVSGEKFNTRAVVDAVAGGRAPQKVDEMRRRCRILDALEKADTDLHLEDADHAHLCELLKVFEFGVAHPELLAIIDGILDAPTRAQAPDAANDRAA